MFELFRAQLQKDIESSAIDAEFTKDLPRDYDQLRNFLIKHLAPVFKNNVTCLHTLLYRVDISEATLRDHGNKNKNLGFEETVIELIIKRVLQKVVLKKKFSE